MRVHILHKRPMHKLAAYLAASESTHEEMAVRLGISRAHLTKLVNRRAYPSRALMQKIASETGGAVPVTAWFEGDAA